MSRGGRRDGLVYRDSELDFLSCICLLPMRSIQQECVPLMTVHQLIFHCCLTCVDGVASVCNRAVECKSSHVLFALFLYINTCSRDPMYPYVIGHNKIWFFVIHICG